MLNKRRSHEQSLPKMQSFDSRRESYPLATPGIKILSDKRKRSLMQLQK